MTPGNVSCNSHLTDLENQVQLGIVSSGAAGNHSAEFPGSVAKPHVLFLIDTFYQRMAGAESALLKMTRLLAGDRYRCSVATFGSRSDLVDIHSMFSCPVYVFPMRRTYDWNSLKVAIKLRELIRSQRVAIIHTFFSTSDLWGGLVAKLSGCPVLVSSRRDMGFLRSWRHRIAYRLMSPLFDQVQAVSEAVRDFSIREDGLNPHKVVTLHNGIDLNEIAAATAFSRTHPLCGLGAASHLIVTVANIRPIKGLDVLIRTAAIVCREFPQAMFLIVGEPHGQEILVDLQDLVRSLGLIENVRFLGKRSDVPALLKACDVFCLLSRSEGLSNALLEAASCGLPCVVTNVGGNNEVVAEGRSGFLVPPERPDLAAQPLLALLRNPRQARQMGAQGREIIEARFTSQVMVRRLMKLYDQLLAQPCI